VWTVVVTMHNRVLELGSVVERIEVFKDCVMLGGSARLDLRTRRRWGLSARAVVSAPSVQIVESTSTSKHRKENLAKGVVRLRGGWPCLREIKRGLHDDGGRAVSATQTPVKRARFKLSINSSSLQRILVCTIHVVPESL